MLFATVLLLGCNARVPADGETKGYCATTDPAVVVGNGESAHVALEDGDEVIMVDGPQGGWHVWYSFAAYNFGEIATFDLVGEDQTLGISVIDESVTQALVAGEDCAATAYGAFGYLPGDDTTTTDVDESPPAYLAGDTLLMRVTVTDFDDPSITATGEVAVTLVCDPADVGNYASCG